MEPTDAWWHEAREEQEDALGILVKAVPKIKKTFSSFHERLVVSRNNPELKNRITDLLNKGTESIFLVPRLLRECSTQDTPALKECMRDFAEWFKTRIVAGELPPILNARQLLYRIHRFNKNNPVRKTN